MGEIIIMKEGASFVKRQVRPKIDLADIVLSWSLEDIFNENLYKHQVEKIPDAFRSWDHYLCCYTFPLFEETRANVHSSMEVLDKAPLGEGEVMISFEEVDGPEKVIYCVVKDVFWEKRVGVDGALYKTLPGDLVVISDKKLETVSDLNHAGWNWTLASVVTAREVNFSTILKLKMPRDIGTRDGVNKKLHIVFLANLTTSERIWDAMGMNKNLNCFGTILYESAGAEKQC